MRESNASLEVHLANLSHILVEIWETPYLKYRILHSLKSQAGNLSHRGKVSKETEIELQGDKVLHHFWSKPVDLHAFLPRPADFHLCPAPQNFVLASPRPVPRKYGPPRSSLLLMHHQQH